MLELQNRTITPVLPTLVEPPPKHTTDNTIHQQDADHEHGELKAIEMEAKALRSDLSSADFEKTKAILRRLKSLSGRVTAGGRSSRRAIRTIGVAIAKAQLQADEMEIEDNRLHSRTGCDERFERHVYNFMSTSAQRFYDSIDVNSTYTIAPVDETGSIVPGEVKEIGGHKLRRLFSMIKYHSLDEKHKKEILDKTFGIDAKEDGKHKTAALLKAEINELQKLHEALNEMEAYKAFVVLSQSTKNVKMGTAKIDQNNDKFLVAHEMVKIVHAKYEALILNPEDKVAEAALQFAKAKLKTHLRDEIINKILLEHPSDSHVISGGIEVATSEPGLYNMPVAEATSAITQNT